MVLFESGSPFAPVRVSMNDAVVVPSACIVLIFGVTPIFAGVFSAPGRIRESEPCFPPEEATTVTFWPASDGE